VAVEVELSLKGTRRLEAICRAWARCRIVSEVRYYAPPYVQRAVSRAVSTFRADDAIRILSLEEALKEAADVRFAA
jgi:predicted metallopeptidase